MEFSHGIVSGIHSWYLSTLGIVSDIHPRYSFTHEIDDLWYCDIHPMWCSFTHGIVTSTHDIHSPMELTRGIVTSTNGIHSPMELTCGIVFEKYYT